MDLLTWLWELLNPTNSTDGDTGSSNDPDG